MKFYNMVILRKIVLEVFIHCRSDFEDLDKIKDIKFKTASWGKVYESRRKDSKLSSSCMTDYNGPIENVFEQCRLRRNKVNRMKKWMAIIGFSMYEDLSKMIIIFSLLGC